MRILFAGQVPKDLNYPDSNEDAFEIDEGSGRIALSDGASESFDSKTWAQLLVKSFVANPAINSDWLSLAVDSYLSNYEIGSLSWSKQAAFERGSFATLVGVECFKIHSSIYVISVGDSLAVLISGTDFVESFPYKSAEEFRQRPTLLGTNKKNNHFVGESDFYSVHSKTWSVSSTQTPKLLCMTDALAEWALMLAAEGASPWVELLSIKNDAELRVLVESEREKKLMRVDDVTLISISFD